MTERVKGLYKESQMYLELSNLNISLDTVTKVTVHPLPGSPLADLFQKVKLSILKEEMEIPLIFGSRLLIF